MNANDLCYLPATELRNLYQTGEVSPVEVTEAVLARIDRFNPHINAYVTVTSQLARQQARIAEKAYRENEPPPALAGIPMSIKDLTPTEGIRTTRGSLVYRDSVPDFNSTLVERLYTAGSVMLGKTNTPEYGWKGDTTNRVVGSTHNPWEHDRSAGGSSGGAAAAVAAGLGPLAQGSDGAGSIRVPSSFCGIFGLKPSWGLVPKYPASAVEPLAHEGPMTRTVRDAALMLNVIAGADPRDRLSWSSGIDYLAALEGGISGLRVAWTPDLGYAPVAPEVRSITARAAARFTELGCHVEEVHPAVSDPWDIVDVLWSAAFGGVYFPNLDEVRDQLDPGLVQVIERGKQFSAPDLAAALARRNDYWHTWRVFMEDYDLVLTPTTAVTAFKAGVDYPSEINGVPMSYLSWMVFTYPINITGQPAANVPCGFSSAGLPVGLQIIGRWHDDATVLRASAAFEKLSPWAEKRPTLE